MNNNKAPRKWLLKDDDNHLYSVFFTNGVWITLSYVFRNPPNVVPGDSDEYREIQKAYWVCECHHPEFDPNHKDWFIKKENRADLKVRKS